MKVGVIGLGSIGSRHERNLKKLGHTVIKYDPKWRDSTNLEEIRDKADAVVIASPTVTHYDYIKKYDGKPTFVEKPIHDQTLAGVRDAIDFNSVVMVGYNLRFHSCVLKAKEWLAAGMIGTPMWANLVCAEKNTKYPDHVILNWSHEIDLALHLLGPCHTLACVSNSYLADIIVKHDVSGCQSTIHLDYLTEPEIRQTIIVGEKATVIIDIANRYAWLRDTKNTIIDAFQGHDSAEENYVDEMETFIARTEGKETVGCTGAEGLEVLRTCLDAKQLAECAPSP